MGCNKCIAKCPVKANVAFLQDGENKVRVDPKKCIHCGQCIEACDHGVRGFADDTEQFFLDLENKVPISMVVAPAARFNFENHNKLFGFLRSRGVKLIYDASFGAEIVVWGYLKTLKEHNLKAMIAQPCPVVVNYIQKYRPALMQHLAPIHSPMVCTAIYMREYKGIDGKIAFLSPCIGKSDEISSCGHIDYNVTFEKLEQYLKTHHINLDPIDAVDYDNLGKGLGLLFSRSGGLRENIRYYLEDAWVRQIDGTDQSIHYLEEYAKRLHTDQPLPLVLDILNCQYGCNRGTGTCKAIAIDEMDYKMNLLKREFTQEERKGNSPTHQLMEYFDKHLDITHFMRVYEDKSQSIGAVECIDFEEIYRRLYKTTEALRKTNCYACGYGSCHAFVQAVAEGANHLGNCIEYNRKALISEKERSLELHQQYEALVNQALEAIVLIDKATHQVIDVNPSYSNMTGFSKKEAQQFKVDDIIFEEPQNSGYLELLHQKGWLKSRLQKLKTKQGTVCEVERTAVVIHQDKGARYLFNFREVAKQRRLEHASYKDVRLAGQLQKKLLPKNFLNDQVEIRIVYSPFSKVSGDFLSYTWKEEQNVLSGYLFDITGHGVATAMQMAAVRVVLDEILNSAELSTDLLHQINRRLKRYLDPGTFIALVAFEFDLVNNTVKLAAGGINQIPMYSGTIPTTLTVEGGYLGILKNPDVDMVMLPVWTEDKFYFCSDGLLDLMTEELPALSDFDTTVGQLMELTRSPKKFDDCSAICIRLKAIKQFPKIFDIFSQANMQELRNMPRQFLQGYPDPVALETELILNEAVNNALDRGTHVRIRINKFGMRLVIRVKDNGEGFDGNGRIKAITETESRGDSRERGRGIFLMTCYSNKILYNRSGNEVLLVKNLFGERVTECEI